MTSMQSDKSPGVPKSVVVVGGGFTGLSCAYELACKGMRVTVLEADSEIGGLAAGYPFEGTTLERFYHHWFTSDRDIMGLIEELGLSDHVSMSPTATGMYYANKLFRLQTPFDVLRFDALGIIDRIRLGLLVLKARRIKDWHELDSVTAADWLREIGGQRVFEVVWWPLLKGKFGAHAERVSAAWFWAKLVLRGGSRGKKGEENLAYFDGGFARLASYITDAITAQSGEVRTGVRVTGLTTDNGVISAVQTDDGEIPCDAVVLTPALPIIADILGPHLSQESNEKLRGISYLGNVCLVLVLERSLSDLYWMNINDPTFPFVGIIEHTNFEPPTTYGGKHVVYLSRYLSHDDPVYSMNDDQVLAYALPHLKRMFPDFDEGCIDRHFVWRAAHAQPVVSTGYAACVPDHQTPIANGFIATMAQIYPEDRGTNYAVRDGRAVAKQVLQHLNDLDAQAS